MNCFSFDVYNYRGKKLRAKLESYLQTGKVSSLALFESEQSDMDMPE